MRLLGKLIKVIKLQADKGEEYDKKENNYWTTVFNYWKPGLIPIISLPQFK